MNQAYYLNKAQARHFLLKANKIRGIVGRGGGKSTGFAAPRALQLCEEMPEASIAIVGDSFVQLLTKTLPSLVTGLNGLGWIEGRDFFFGDYAPRKWKWAKPKKSPKDPKYLIHLRTGNILGFVSQHQVGSANGYDFAATIADEAKFLNKKRYNEELVPALRGEARRFENSWAYRSQAFYSDMPVTENAMWLVEDKHSTEQEVEDVIALELLMNSLLAGRSKYSDVTWKSKYQHVVSALAADLNTRRKKLNVLMMASSLSNIENLGEGFIIDMHDTLTEFEFRTSIMNHRVLSRERNFYSDLSDLVHGYSAIETTALLDLGTKYVNEEHSSAFDGDVLSDDSLHIAMDYNGYFNCIVTGQIHNREPRFLKNHYSSYPNKLQHAVIDWKKYYRHHRNKHVYYFIDKTANYETAISNTSFADTALAVLRGDEYGSWNVTVINVGSTDSYSSRHTLWNQVLTNKHSIVSQLRYNKSNCNEWFESCKLAGLIQTDKTIEKDKSSERVRNKAFASNQVRATHLSEAGDVLLIGMIQYIQSNSHLFFGSIQA